MSAIGSKRGHNGAASPTDPKRLRTSAEYGEDAENAQAPEGDTSSCLFKQLMRQCLPPKVLALPHVTKLIATMLMTPDEAITEAARTGQADWVLELLGNFYCDISTAIHHAVRRGDAIVMKMLVDVFVDDMEPESEKKATRAFDEGVVAAAGLGRVHIVELLVREIFHKPWRRGFRTIRDALDKAAAKGQLQVVKFLIDHAEQTRYIDRFRFYPVVDSLTHAIHGGNAEVINFLLTHPRLRWNLQKAFTAAMKRDNNALAERLYQLYPVQRRGHNLFADLAASGNLAAVKYLYYNGHDDMESVGKAFKGAAGGFYEKTNVVEFLLSTGRIAPGAFDKAFKNACARSDNMDIPMLLYKTKRASQHGINRAFATVRMPALMSFLYENENISDGALIAAFKKAIHRQEKETLEILQFISKEKCIPAELIFGGLTKAVKMRATDLVERLGNDRRVTPAMTIEAFTMAATSGYADLVSILYNKQRISPETLLKAFTEAAHRGHLDATKLVMSFMAVEENVPREFKCKAFVIAARHGQMPVVKIVCESERGEWPLHVLKQALDAADDSNDKIVKLMRKIVCHQQLVKLHQD